jgi:hypothetical protein
VAAFAPPSPLPVVHGGRLWRCMAARSDGSGGGSAANTHCSFGGGARADRVDDEDSAKGGEALVRQTCTCAVETSQHVVDVKG